MGIVEDANRKLSLMRVIFRLEAEEELTDAVDWYEARSQGLGADLLRCVDACVERIIRQPESYPVVHRGIRMAIVRRFPYLILYRVSEEVIHVLAVFHGKRDPKIWKSR